VESAAISGVANKKAEEASDVTNKKDFAQKKIFTSLLQKEKNSVDWQTVIDQLSGFRTAQLYS